MGDQRIDQRAGGVAGPGMHGEARGLVDDDEVGILVDDGERHGLGLRRGRLRLGHVHRVNLPGLGPVPEPCNRRTVARDLPGADQRLQPRAAEFVQASG